MYTTLIDVETLDSLRDDRETIIFDCRFSLADTDLGMAHWQAGHVPGARYAHLDDDLSGQKVDGHTGRHPLPAREEMSARFRQWSISNSSQLVCYDDDAGAFASRFWWLCRWLGHEACAVLDGGLTAWQAAGKPVDRHRPALPTAGDFMPTDSLVDVVGFDEVARGEHLLIDAREAARYRGEVEPIDPVAGHIPDAINLPFKENLGPDGYWLSASELQVRFKPVVEDAADRPIAHYCGSGVTAAHNVLAMAHAGLPTGALYAGSWSEWITRNAARYPKERQDG